MSQNATIGYCKIFRGDNVTTTDIVERADGTAILIGEIASWDIVVYDESDGSLVFELLGQAPLAIGAGGTYSNVVLPKDGYSNEPYNFRHTLPANAFVQEAQRSYRYIYRHNTVAFGVEKTVGIIDVIAAELSG